LGSSGSSGPSVSVSQPSGGGSTSPPSTGGSHP
jgi:hypothetical protein